MYFTMNLGPPPADAGHRSDIRAIFSAYERKCIQGFLQNALGCTILALVAPLPPGKLIRPSGSQFPHLQSRILAPFTHCWRMNLLCFLFPLFLPGVPWLVAALGKDRNPWKHFRILTKLSLFQNPLTLWPSARTAQCQTRVHSAFQF